MNRATARDGFGAFFRHSCSPGSIQLWVIWSVLTFAAGAGLSRMHVRNSLDAWSPHQLPSKAIATYLVVGFDRSDADEVPLEQALRALPSVSRCFGPASAPALRITGITPDNLILGHDGRYAGIYCFAKTGIDPDTLYADVFRTLQCVAGGCTDRFAIGGSAAFSVALSDVSRQRMPIILTTIIVIGGIMLWLLTRSAHAAIAGLAAISMAMLILLGTASWCDVDLDMSLLLVPPLIISLGYSYAAHAALRRDAAQPLILCCAASALGVAAFGATDLPSIRGFALWGTVGVVLVWACVMSLVPPPSRTPARPEYSVDRSTRYWLLQLLRHRAGAAVLICLAVCIIGVILAPSLTVQAQPLDYFLKTARLVRDNATLEKHLTGMLPFEVVLRRDADFTHQLRESPQLRKAVNVSLLTGRTEQVLWCLANNDALESLDALFARWRQDADSRKLALRVQGVAPQLLEVRQQMRHVAAASIPAMLGVAMIATGILGRSFRAAIFGLVINLFPIAAIVALARLLSWPIQMPTLMVGAIGIGSGIDDAIHLLWLRRKHPLARSLRTALRACAGSSLIAAVCMSAFMLSPFRPTAQFGMLMALVLLLAAIADLILLPALCRTFAISRPRLKPLRVRPSRRLFNELPAGIDAPLSPLPP